VGCLFHEDAIAVFPAAKHRLTGRDAIVQSYIDYCRSEKTHAFEELDHAVDIFGDSAVVSYRFSVRYEAQGIVRDEFGQEILVFMRRHGQWGVVWRSQVQLAQ
jgi:ketosteroid isomerase-like protein